MPTRNAVITQFPHARLVTWSGLLNTDDGDPFEGAEFADRTAQVFGTFGAAGSVQLEGSNNGTNWNILADPQGNASTSPLPRLPSPGRLSPCGAPTAPTCRRARILSPEL
jgi:hypothetical protein